MSIPVVLVSGYLGSGKTTIINQFIASARKKAAVISYTPTNITVVEQIHDVRKRKSILHECLFLKHSSTIQQLETSLEELIEKERVEVVFVELGATVNPHVIADELSSSRQSLFELKNMITIIDGQNFWLDFTSDTELYVHDADGYDKEAVADIVVSQIEFCNCLVVNKSNGISRESLRELKWVLEKLQPTAEIVELEKITKLKELLNNNPFNLTKTKFSAGWMKELNQKQNRFQLIGEYGIGSFVYERTVPFHPERFQKWFLQYPPEVIRTKGIVWALSDLTTPLLLSQAGPSLTLEEGSCWESLPKKSRLVFIGIDINREQIVAQLDRCLVTEQEFQHPGVHDRSLI
ncbi:hypothetical protein BKP45_21250 [Anaerobacillus alkalidiazotrophicus]|uniref:CobW C-terminal domain-containing protein n=1 Tax=Anaerobacillus alkalidiazotrophicus TaxID=472963 RepID=A0A1S2LVH0_9BACI|nr:GTP-binding protein [Anaerobacillus alkalidiazotrophicus]OIJ16532.1 hypothetical protein BKP45_21250 [Anaerobacillus alkalidiazotrophicus]